MTEMADSSLLFTQLVPGTPLYRTDPAPAADAPQLLYALVGKPADAPDKLTADQAWSDWSGAFLFLPPAAVIEDPAGLVAALDALLDTRIPYRQWLLWLAAGDAAAVAAGVPMVTINKAAGAGNGNVAAPTSLPFANLAVQLSAQLAVQPDLDGPVPGLRLVPSQPAGTTIVLQQPATGASVQMPNDEELALPLAGTQLGLLCLPLRGDAGLFYQLFAPGDGSEIPPASAECRFFYGGETSPCQLRFPFLLGAVPDPAPPQASLLPLRVTIDPLAPADIARTRFAFDLAGYGGGGPALPVSTALRTTAGTPLSLTPQAGAGFGLGLRPDGAGGKAAYLTPAGDYTLGQATAAGDLAANPPLANGAIELMCGVYGSEFLLLADGDAIRFVGSDAAFAQDFTPQPSARAAQDGEPGPLGDAYLTGWAGVVPGANTDKTFPNAIKQSYCAQASGAVYYATQPGTDLPLPMAVGARIADLSSPDAGQRLPIAPYGLVFHSDDVVVNPNEGTSAADIVDFDATILSRARFASLAPDRCLGPLFFDMAQLEALAGGYVRTPQGMLVGLNDGDLGGPQPAGTWKSLLLARSPQTPQQLLQFRAATSPSGCSAGSDPYLVVSPYLSTALMEPAAVLFVARPDLLGTFDNQIQLGEFPIRIAVANGDDSDDPLNPLGTNCVLLFKFATGRSVADLATDPSGWGSVEFLTGDAAAVTRISSQVHAYIEQARTESAAAQKAEAYDYFADFLARVDDPAWTGTLALNPELDQGSLPADIQMLLCGMRDGDGLRCHHFGITANTAPATGSPADAIDNSALFGLVHYNAELDTEVATPFDFQTLRLNALFDNSVIKHFDSRIAMSLATVLGNPARLATAGENDVPETNTIEIDGVLQVADGVTRVVFVTKEPRLFAMPKTGNAYRVLARQSVTQAGLAPVAVGGNDAEGTDATVTVTARFTLDGAFGFNPRKLSSGADADLFSYGIDDDASGGLGYSGYALTMVSQVPAKGKTPPPIITPPPGTIMQLDSDIGSPRAQSLMATLPLKVTGFATAMPGAAHVTQVTGIGLDAVVPVYALATELVMGTLGALSDAGPLEGQLLLGWVPGGNDQTPDKVGALLAPPPSMLGGNFKLQGVISSTYGPVEILRPTLNGSDVYVLVLHDVQFMLGVFGLYDQSMGERSLTFFGEPGAASSGVAADDDDTVSLSWFLGKPDLDAQEARRPARPTALTSTTPLLAFTPAVYVLAGIKVTYDQEASSIVDEIVANLAQVPLSTKASLDAILSGSTAIPINYDPDAGVTVAVDLEFGPVTFKFVFCDPYVYGGYLAIEKSDDNGEKGGGGSTGVPARNRAAEPEPEKKGILSSLSGFVLEIAYRKISDGLGAWSASFTITGHIGTDDYYLQLPTVGLVIYTNSDFRVDIGWPFVPEGGGPQPIAVQFQVEGIPLRASAGLYLAKLRSADAPQTLGNDFALIWRFGLGLSFGVNKEGSRGPMSYNAGVIAFLTFEGFLASTSGHMTEDGVDYKWFAGQLGAKAYFGGEIDLKIIMAGLSASATLVLQVAYETNHATLIRLAFRLSVAVEFRFLFFKVSFSFDADIDVLPPLHIGSGPPASIDGPDPVPARLLVARDAAVPAPRPFKHIDVQLLTGHAAADDRIVVPLWFVLQPTLVNTGNGAAPQAIATLMISIKPAGAELDDFSRFATALVGWLVADYGGQGALADQLAAVAAALASGSVDDAVDAFLQDNFTFVIAAAGALGAEANFVAFPMLSPLVLRYNGTDIPFGAPPVPAGYPAALRAYFQQLSPRLKALPANLAAAAAGPSAADLICSDMIVLIAKQIVAQLQDIAKDNPADTLQQALQALGPNGFANVAGLASRFAYHGVRLPTPGSEPFGCTLEGMYALTGQQVPLVQVAGVWQTSFTLGLATGASATWISFGPDPQVQSVTDVLDPNLVLTQPVVPAWLTTGGGLQPLPPVREETSLFYLGQPLAWTTPTGAASILPFGDQLARRLAAFTAAGGTGATATVQQVTAAPARSVEAKFADVAPLPAQAALFVPIALRQVTPPGASKPLDSVFELAGTDNATRALLEMLVRTSPGQATLSFLLASGGAAYQAPAKAAQIVLFKANLSTLNEPPTLGADGRIMLATDQPPVSATPADVAAFLTLIWEESVVHSGGFYLYLPGVAASAFSGGQAPAAVVVQSPVPAASPVPLAGWCNTMVLTPPPSANAGAIAITVADADGPWSQTNPNHDAGLAGFEVLWPQPPAQPAIDGTSTPVQKAAYAEALYSLLQYRVTALSGTAAFAATLPSRWSLPVGPNQKDAGSDWHFSSTIASAALLGADNRYAGVGTSITFGVTLLDLYGNQLPSEQDVAAPIVYNDPLLGLDQWPGARGYYAFSAGATDKVVLSLAVDFDPKRLGTGAQDSADPAVLRSACSAYRNVLDQLTDPLQAGKAGAGASLRTVFATQPLTEAEGGVSLNDALTAWVSSVIAWLDAAAGGTPPPVPATLILDFALAPSAPASLPSDLTPLTVSLVFARDPATVVPEIAASLPGVLRVSSTLGAATSLDPTAFAGPASGPDMQLTAFAQAFENAWYGFDGGNAQLKLAQGLTGRAGAASAPASAELWFVRVGANAGIGITVPNAGKPGADQLPVTFAPPPLSTMLISRSVQVRSYAAHWTGDGSDVVLPDRDNAFVDIDMTAWAFAFLAAMEALFTPEMGAAIATLDPDRYASIADHKQTLAGVIASTLAPVLLVPGQTPSDAGAIERFRQALLNNLSSAYALSAIVDVPTEIALAGVDEPSAPPNLYGHPAGPGLQGASGGQPFSLSPASIVLKTGTSNLVYLVSSRQADARAWLDTPLTYEAAFLEHDFDPAGKLFGYEPSSWLSFIVPDFLPQRPAATRPLSIPLGRNAIPLPLRVFPPMPAISAQGAVLPAAPATLADALTWSYRCTVATPQAAQDSLLLSLMLNDSPAAPAARAAARLAEAVAGDDPPRPDPADLFEALARFSFEYPQIEPYLAAVPAAAFSGGDAKVARKALERLDTLIAGAVLRWASWINPALVPPTARGSYGDPLPPVDRATWAYTVDFSQWPNLVVARMPIGIALPPWPQIAGFTTPTGSGRTATYLPQGKPAQGAPLTFTFADLPTTAAQSAHVKASVTRNANLVPPGMPAGTAVNRAFVYCTPEVTAKDPVLPLLDLPSQPFAVGGDAPNLSAAIDAFLAPFLAQTSLAGLTVRQIQFEVGGAYWFTLAQGDRDETIRSGNWIFLAQNTVSIPPALSVGAISAADFQQKLVETLVGWHGGMQPSDAGASIRLPVTLYGMITQGLVPLVRLGMVEIAVPHANPGWWS
ncbi:hypothetical protein [Sphingomonas pituitosa]|uniref:hypothetical protein n=1 Tax=Sphingomonas pituitosa TaxID=99597 RepID=UPI00082C3491|nr:hypothetical protein [Sphingomonas pituitosa]